MNSLWVRWPELSLGLGPRGWNPKLSAAPVLWAASPCRNSGSLPLTHAWLFVLIFRLSCQLDVLCQKNLACISESSIHPHTFPSPSSSLHLPIRTPSPNPFFSRNLVRGFADVILISASAWGLGRKEALKSKPDILRCGTWLKRVTSTPFYDWHLSSLLCGLFH